MIGYSDRVGRVRRKEKRERKQKWKIKKGSKRRGEKKV
jgi:hypothetical protein